MKENFKKVGKKIGYKILDSINDIGKIIINETAEILTDELDSINKKVKSQPSSKQRRKNIKRK